MNYFRADEEIIFLGFHLENKLWKINNIDTEIIDPVFGQNLDRNYYPFKLGLNISDEGDSIKNRWRNQDFDSLCDQIKNIQDDKITNIIFELLDWGGQARDDVIKFMNMTKQKTLQDNLFHNFTMPLTADSGSNKSGLTYISSDSNDIEKLGRQLIDLCQMRKYYSKGDIRIGFGSLKDSKNTIDAVFYSDDMRSFNEKMDKLSKELLTGKNQGIEMRLGKKIGRNEKCSCGSRLKYKKCCGNTLKK